MYKRQTLSGGEKQKAALTVLLAMNPDILLLDEPFASIDPTSRKQFIQILARLHQAGKTILVCDHDFSDYADVVDVYKRQVMAEEWMAALWIKVKKQLRN